MLNLTLTSFFFIASALKKNKKKLQYHFYISPRTEEEENIENIERGQTMDYLSVVKESTQRFQVIPYTICNYAYV